MTEIKDGKKKKTGSDREISKLTDVLAHGFLGPRGPNQNRKKKSLKIKKRSSNDGQEKRQEGKRSFAGSRIG